MLTKFKNLIFKFHCPENIDFVSVLENIKLSFKLN